MLFRCLFGVAAIACTATLLLSFHGVVASENYTEEYPQLTECTQRGISLCYTQYAAVFYWPILPRNKEGEFNEEAYRLACRFFNETSNCYEGFTRCPESMRSNFTRREKGYRAYRALVCNTEVFKGAITARNCTDPAKLRACFANETGDLITADMEYEESHCLSSPTARVCYEPSWIASCPMPLPSTLEVVKKVLDATEWMHDCKRMYRHEDAPNDTDAAEETRRDAVVIPDNLAAEAAGTRAILRENAQAIASLIEKVKIMQEANEHQAKETTKSFKQLTTSLESIEGALHALLIESARRSGSHSESPEEKARLLF